MKILIITPCDEERRSIDAVRSQAFYAREIRALGHEPIAPLLDLETTAPPAVVLGYTLTVLRQSADAVILFPGATLSKYGQVCDFATATYGLPRALAGPYRTDRAVESVEEQFKRKTLAPITWVPAGEEGGDDA